jgi:hypothetical protein
MLTRQTVRTSVFRFADLRAAYFYNAAKISRLHRIGVEQSSEHWRADVGADRSHVG